ncbi:MAG: hypothetical protein LLG01_06210 [Planctomycetaceae bacterium]|nr:hypothetical protein [Planctomycetaceae bacterium]
MADKSGQFDWVIKTAQTALWVTLGALALAVLAAAVGAVVEIVRGHAMQALPLAGVIVCAAAAAAWTVALYGLIKTVVSNEQAVSSMADRLADLEPIFADQRDSMHMLVDLGKLSDQAKSLVYHEVEVEAFREAIHADLIRQDYRSAQSLLDSIEHKLGYADEASRLRDEMESNRKASLDEKIDTAVRRVMSIVARYDWSRATRETRRLQNLFPDNPKIASLGEHVEQARLKRKSELLQAYGEATRKNDVDAGIQLLTELDSYLTPQEAGALRESARGVFRAKLHNLGVQFAIRVSEQQWAEAVSVGEEIIRSYPNSRMAQEVRDKLGQLRTRAAAASPSAGQNGPITS